MTFLKSLNDASLFSAKFSLITIYFVSNILFDKPSLNNSS